MRPAPQDGSHRLPGGRPGPADFPEPPEGHAAPDDLDDPERPGPRQEPVGARESTADGEAEDEARISAFQGVHEQHERQCGDPEDGHRVHARIISTTLKRGITGRSSSVGREDPVEKREPLLTDEGLSVLPDDPQFGGCRPCLTRHRHRHSHLVLSGLDPEIEE